ncbi:O3 family O-antigen polymerase [Escherichia coli]|nr:O3 family O-antigen polymerase [Escherichia coli]
MIIFSTFLLFYFFIYLSLLPVLIKEGARGNGKYFYFFDLYIYLVLASLIIYIICTRDIFSDSDTERYLSILEYYRINGFYLFDKNYIFAVYTYLYSLYIDGYYMYMIIPLITLLYSYCKLVKPLKYPVYSFSLVLIATFPVFWQLSASAFKQCIAISFILLALVHIIQTKYKQAVLLSLIASSFHFTALTFFIFSLFFYIRKERVSLNLFFLIWFFSVIFSTSGLNSYIPSIIPFYDLVGESKVNIYLESTNNATGFRVDFFLFSLAPVLIIFINRTLVIKDRYIKMIALSYLYFNSIYNIMSFIPFSDRVAAYSWCLSPIILLWSALKCRSSIYMLSSIGIALLNPLIFMYYNSMFIFLK